MTGILTRAHLGRRLRLAGAVTAALATAGILAQSVTIPGREPAASFAPSFAPIDAAHRNLGTAPYDHIDRDEIRISGYSETAGALDAFFPTINRPHFTIEDGTAHQEPFTMRGLSPDHTMVLINGHKRHSTALLNVNGTIGRGSVSTSLMSVPMASIEHVEMLRAGSDTRFGSGAIAGVINVKLSEEIGRKVLLLWGRTDEEDGAVTQAMFNVGTILGQNGVITITAGWRDRGSTDRATPDTRQQYLGTATGTNNLVAISGAVGSGTGPAPAGVAFDSREATADRHAQRFGDAASREQVLVFNSRLPVSPQSEVYAFGDFMNRRGESALYFRRPGDSRVVRALWPDGFQPLLEARIASWNVGTGWRGRANGWSYDASIVGGSDTVAYDVNNTNNPTLGTKSPRSFYAGKLGYAELCAMFDLSHPLQLGLAQPAEFSLGLEYRRENYWIAAGSDNSWRDGGGAILDGPDAGRIPPEGAQGFPGFLPIDVVDAVRNTGGVDVEVTQSIGRRLRVTASARCEQAGNFGETTDGKIAGRLDVWGGVALRGSAGTTYRQPHLAQRWYSSTAINFVGGTPYRIRTFTVDDPVARALDAQDLRPEHAQTMSAGLAWEPARHFGAEIDFYRIDLRDRLILSSNFIGSAVSTFLEGKGINGVTGARFFSNDAATRTEGFDAVMHASVEFASDHRLTLRAAYNRNKSRMTHVGPAPSGLVAVGVSTPLFDLAEEVRLTRSQPHDNVRVSVAWEWHRLEARLGLMRYGEVETVALTNVTTDQIDALTPGYRVRIVTRTLPRASGSTEGGPQIGGPSTATDVVQTFDAKWVTDLNLRLRLTENIRWGVGVSNLFDVYPTRNIASRIVNGRAYSGNDNGGTTPYNTVSPFGFNGAFFYSRLDVRF